MVNWMDRAEIVRDTKIFAAFSLVLCGIVAWEVLGHIDFDVSIITRKRKWRWPMVLYFICRICMILHIFSIAINLNAIQEIDCMGVTWVSKIADAIGTCSSSLILALRTHAVWHQDKRVGGGLLLLFLGQISLWVQTFRYSTTAWSAQRGVCLVIKTAPRPLLTAVFAYTMVFDLIILLLCTVRLRASSRHGGISTLLLRDGIGYFCAAFAANLVQTVFAALQLNPVMNILCLPFALVVSAVAATTVFRNVFEMHDSWAHDPSSGQPGAHSNNSSAHHPLGAPQPPSRGMFSRRGSSMLPGKSESGIALGQLGSQRGEVRVHRVVEVDVDGMPESRLHYSDSRTVPGDLESLASAEEKKGNAL